MKFRAVFILCLACALSACGQFSDVPQTAPQPVAAARQIQSAVVDSSNVRTPVNLSAFVPCAAGGAGEVVVLTGNLHVLMTMTTNANETHIDMHFQPQGIRGFGSVTGDKYQGTGVTRDDVNESNAVFPLVFTFINNFRIIGQGPRNNFLLHETSHFTVNRQGVITAQQDNFSARCR
jgi:hypothetical protein